MNLNRNVFISAPRDVRLRHNPLLKQVKEDILREIVRLGYDPSIFLTPEGSIGLATGQGWSPQSVLDVAKKCVGSVLIGIPFWKVTLDDSEAWLPSDYCLHEGAVAHALGLPVLAISIGIVGRGFFDDHAKGHLILSEFPPSPSWTASNDFLGPLQKWSDEIQSHRAKTSAASAYWSSSLKRNKTSLTDTTHNWTL